MRDEGYERRGVSAAVMHGSAVLLLGDAGVLDAAATGTAYLLDRPELRVW